MTDDPLSELHGRTHGSGAGRDEAIKRYSFAVPSPAAIGAIAAWAATGLVEVGAGAGYWAWRLRLAGIDVAAYDVDPPPSGHWFADVAPWSPVERGDHRVVDVHGDRCLLLVWPTKNETWPAEAVERFHAAGGERVAYVGEGPGAGTGDDRFHALIGGLDRCYRCAYDLADLACTCGVRPLFEVADMVAIPTWQGHDDRLLLLRRVAPGRRRRPWNRRRRP